jgi:hypothetical protein
VSKETYKEKCHMRRRIHVSKEKCQKRPTRDQKRPTLHGHTCALAL